MPTKYIYIYIYNMTVCLFFCLSVWYVGWVTSSDKKPEAKGHMGDIKHGNSSEPAMQQQETMPGSSA